MKHPKWNRWAFMGLMALLLPLIGACRTAQPAGPYDELIDEFSAGAERGPSVKTLYTVAHIMAAQGRDRECELVLQKLIDTHPEFMPAYNELAELYMRTEDMGSAETILRAGLELRPADPVLLNNLGMWHFVQSDYEGALPWFTQGTSVDPTDARSRANLAACLGMLERSDEALALYYQVLPPWEAHHNLGVLCEATGQAERAQQEFELAQQLKLKRSPN